MNSAEDTNEPALPLLAGSRRRTQPSYSVDAPGVRDRLAGSGVASAILDTVLPGAAVWQSLRFLAVL